MAASDAEGAEGAMKKTSLAPIYFSLDRRLLAAESHRDRQKDIARLRDPAARP
jgi:hypothetical protein